MGSVGVVLFFAHRNHELFSELFLLLFANIENWLTSLARLGILGGKERDPVVPVSCFASPLDEVDVGQIAHWLRRGGSQ